LYATFFFPVTMWLCGSSRTSYSTFFNSKPIYMPLCVVVVVVVAAVVVVVVVVSP
jgi:hypothetical protein